MAALGNQYATTSRSHLQSCYSDAEELDMGVDYYLYRETKVTKNAQAMCHPTTDDLLTAKPCNHVMVLTHHTLNLQNNLGR